jgi:hypothetical protein
MGIQTKARCETPIWVALAFVHVGDDLAKTIRVPRRP